MCDPDGKYKTELCKNWIETARCRFEDKCRFAHGQEELTMAAIQAYNTQYKSKNCRTFYNTKSCMYGTRCMFRHEHRTYKQLHRHYYTPQMYKLELLFDNAVSQKQSLTQAYESSAKSLSCFAQIHTEYDAEQAQLAASQEPMTLDSDLPETEMSPEMAKSNSYGGNSTQCKSEKSDSNNGSNLNTTVDSGIDEFSLKLTMHNFCNSPARITPESSDNEMGDESDCGDLEVSPLSLGLDFV